VKGYRYLGGHVRKFVVRALGVVLLATPALGLAEDEPDAGHHHVPRPEAIAACKDKSAGDSCEFDAPRGHIVGTCRTVRSGDLACVHPHHRHGTP
jgi:hypothetical protein